MLYALMGSGRGVGGVALNSNIMELVPPHFMGRIQNTFMLFGTGLQLVLGFMVGLVAHRVGLLWGFVMIGSVYLLSVISALWPVRPEARLKPLAETTVD
jgi:hypothetical protein